MTENVGYWGTFREFLRECKRVLKITRKPSMEEFKTIVKVCAIGMGVIGLIGFLIQMVWRQLL